MMRINLFFLLIIFVSMIIIDCKGQKNEDNKNNIVDEKLSIDTSLIAILKYENDYGIEFPNCEPASLTSENLKEIDIILKKCIDEYNIKKETEFKDYITKNPEIKTDKVDWIIDLKTYKRQYLAVINNHGEKEVWVNCFCDDFNRNWKEEEILVKDGGKCYFNLKINLTQKIFYEFCVNGYA